MTLSRNVKKSFAGTSSSITIVAAMGAIVIPQAARAACPANIDTASGVVISGGIICDWTPTGDTPGSHPAVINRTVANGANYLQVGQSAAGAGYDTLNVSGDVTMNIDPVAGIGIGAKYGAVFVTSPSNGSPGGTPGDGSTTAMTSSGNLVINANAGGSPAANVAPVAVNVDFNGQLVSTGDVTVNVKQNIQTSTGALNAYAVLVGSSPGDGSSPSSEAKATFNNLAINIDSSMSNSAFDANNAMAGIRAVAQTGNGSGQVFVSGMTTINTAGPYSVGIYISGHGSMVDLNNSSITTSGTTSSAIKLGKLRVNGNGGGTLISRGHMAIDTTAATGIASILILGDVDPASGLPPSTLNANFDTSSTVIKSGLQAVDYTILDKTTLGSAINATASFNNAQMSTTSATASLILVEGSAADSQQNAVFNLRGNQSLLTAPSNGWLFEVQNYSSFTANIQQATMYGLATTGGSGASAGSFVMNLSDNAIWHLAPNGTTYTSTLTALNMSSGATLDASAANFTVNSDVTSVGGIIDLSGTARTVGQAFTINGNYVGSGNALLKIDTVLAGDGAPSDTLVIDTGRASGSTGIAVNNVGGAGALTTANGILVVDTSNGGTTAAGAFSLANPELRAGSFDYRLFQGGLNGSDPNNWYLRSTFVEGPTPPPTPGPGTFPIIGPELATYGVVQPMAQQLGRSMLGTHDDRLGDLYPVPCQPAETNAPSYTKAPVYTKAPTDCGTDGWRPAVWGRLFGQQIDNHYQAFADPRSDGQIAGMQVGFDFLRSDSLIAGHKDFAGLYFAYGNANVDVSGLVTNAAATAFVLQHTGSLNLNAYSGGAYWTHYGPQGWYLDLVLQGTSYGGAASTEFAHLSTNGSGFISSLEGGYPVALPQFGPGFVLEPQAQVLWQWVSFDSGNDGLGPVALGTTSETTARIGLKGKWTITTDSGQVWQPYVRANFWSDFGGNATTMFGVDSVPLISHAQYMDVDAGFTTKINTHLSAFADAGYQFAVSNDGGGKRDGVKGTAGLRYQW